MLRSLSTLKWAHVDARFIVYLSITHLSHSHSTHLSSYFHPFPQYMLSLAFSIFHPLLPSLLLHLRPSTPPCWPPVRHRLELPPFYPGPVILAGGLIIALVWPIDHSHTSPYTFLWIFLSSNLFIYLSRTPKEKLETYYQTTLSCSGATANGNVYSSHIHVCKSLSKILISSKHTSTSEKFLSERANVLKLKRVGRGVWWHAAVLLVMLMAVWEDFWGNCHGVITRCYVKSYIIMLKVF